ncbi:MAG: alginate O-acetyltransferase complex protein AlgI [Bacteroidia bacterium]|jgi:alginate O-acetyltransferase complex protein AlgI
MLFSSLLFLFIFLPTVLVFNLIAAKHLRNGLLIIFSLFFYAWGGVTDSLILLGSILLNHLIATRIQGNVGTSKKRWLQIGIVTNTLIILSFKYLGFISENLNLLFEMVNVTLSIEQIKIRLPLGISFFTFQQMSMLWDIYRTEEKRKLKLAETALYVSFFPQLIAGPIVRYHDIIDQIRNRALSVNLFHSGVQRFIIGLFKKVIIANTCAIMADEIMDASVTELSSPLAWLGIVAYAFQIYFDFSGYSDMAIGIGRMLGFRILENFNFPYISRSIQEFWRRWHMSLSSWFKDYVYIPLGGNRKSVSRTYFNLLIVFSLTGLWHGATWSFIFWGLFHGFFLVLERLGGKKLIDKLPRPFAWAYTLLVVLIGWVFFRIEDFPDAVNYVALMFGSNSFTEANVLHFLDREKLIVLGLAALFSTTLPKRAIDLTLSFLNKFGTWHHWPLELLKTVILMALLLLCVIYENADSYSPFIYFRF